MTRRWNHRHTPLAMTVLFAFGCGLQDGNLGGNIEMQASSGSDDSNCNPMDPACAPATDDGATGNAEDPGTGDDGNCDPNVDPMCGGGSSGGDDGNCDPNVDPMCGGGSSGGDDGNCDPNVDPMCDPSGSSTGCSPADPGCGGTGTGDDGNCNPMIDPGCDPTGGSSESGDPGTSTGCSPMDPGCG